jgi:putative membrane protein
MKRLFLTTATLMIGVGALWAGDGKKPDSKVDQRFVQGATSGGLLEVKASEVALQRSTSERVKKFAQQMIDDHTKAQRDLLIILKSKGVTPPDALLPLHEAMVDRLKKVKPEEFESEFWKDQLAAHEEAVSLFEAEAKQGQDAELRGFAVKLLPALQEHLATVRRMMTRGSSGVGG